MNEHRVQARIANQEGTWEDLGMEFATREQAGELFAEVRA